MTYLPTGSDWGSNEDAVQGQLIAVSNFNDTKFPGIAYATNQPTLDKFYELQKQLNRAGAARGFSPVPKDGKLGADTLALAKKVSLNAAAVSSLRNLAMYAVIVAQAAKAKADAAGISQNPPAPKPPSPPAILNASTNALVPATPAGASVFGMLTNMSTPTMLALAAGVLGAGYYFTKMRGR